MNKSSWVPEPPATCEDDLSLTQFFKSDKYSTDEGSSKNFELLFELKSKSFPTRPAEAFQIRKQSQGHLEQITHSASNGQRQQSVPLPPHCENDVPLTQIFENYKQCRSDFQHDPLLIDNGEQCTLVSSCDESTAPDDDHDWHCRVDQPRNYMQSENTEQPAKHLLNYRTLTGSHQSKSLPVHVDSNAKTLANNYFSSKESSSLEHPTNQLMQFSSNKFKSVGDKDKCFSYSRALSVPEKMKGSLELNRHDIFKTSAQNMQTVGELIRHKLNCSIMDLPYVDNSRSRNHYDSSYAGHSIDGGAILPLRPVSELPEAYQKVFPFQFFNAVQSKVLDDVLYTDKSLVISAPTGSGKTAIFELAIIRLLLQSTVQAFTAFKVVYMAPIKALCSERYEDWKNKFGPVGLKSMELTGDSLLEDYMELQDVQIIITTPEKWDHMTRRWLDNKSLVQLTRLFLIDEVHLLSDNQRGATLEAVVSRMKTIQSSPSDNCHRPDCGIRFIAVSATIPNVEDVAEWLSSRHMKASYHKIDESCRPVKLRKVVLDFPCAENMSEFRHDMMLSYRVANVIQSYSDFKPTLVFCSTRKGTVQTAGILIKDVKFVNDLNKKIKLQQMANGLKDNKLQDLVVCGVGYHHAGMDLNDRKLVEAMFAQGDLPVLISTSTLAMGVNLPAHLVVIKSTQQYVMGVHQEYTETQILQMIGRAGRPQFDTSATVVIMTRSSTKGKYDALLSGSQLLESSLHQNLIEHLNVEIALTTITDISIALEWLRSTFLYVRVNKNPKHYGIPLGLDKDGIERSLQELCLKNVNALTGIDLVKMDEDGFTLRSTETGRLMARFCVAFETMKNFHKLCGGETLEQLLNVVCLSHEYNEVQLRMSEKRILNTLNKDKARQTIRFPLNGKIKTPSMKVNCLLQAHFGGLPLQDFALQQEVNNIVRSGIRISRCLMEVLWNREHFTALLSSVILVKCFEARMWENSRFVTKQLSGIGNTLSNVLVNAGFTSFEKVLDTNPRDLELILNRQPPFGNHVRDAVKHLPQYNVSITQNAGHNISACELAFTVRLTNADLIANKSTADKTHCCSLLIGDTDNKLVYKAKVSDSVLLRNGVWTRKVKVQRAISGDELQIHLISQRWGKIIA